MRAIKNRRAFTFRHHLSAMVARHTLRRFSGGLMPRASSPMPARAVRLLAAARAAAALAGCASVDADPPAAGQPSFYRSMAQAGADLDIGAAASMISGYRQNNGLGPVTVD